MSELKNVIFVMSEDRSFSPNSGDILKHLRYGCSYLSFSDPFVRLEKSEKKLHAINLAEYIFNLFKDSEVKDVEIILNLLKGKVYIEISPRLLEIYHEKRADKIAFYKNNINDLEVMPNEFIIRLADAVMPNHNDIFIWSDEFGVLTLNDFIIETWLTYERESGDNIRFYINDVLEYKPKYLQINRFAEKYDILDDKQEND